MASLRIQLLGEKPVVGDLVFVTQNNNNNNNNNNNSNTNTNTSTIQSTEDLETITSDVDTEEGGEPSIIIEDEVASQLEVPITTPILYHNNSIYILSLYLLLLYYYYYTHHRHRNRHYSPPRNQLNVRSRYWRMRKSYKDIQYLI